MKKISYFLLILLLVQSVSAKPKAPEKNDEMCFFEPSPNQSKSMFYAPDEIQLQNGKIPVIVHIAQGSNAPTEEEIHSIFENAENLFENDDPTKNVFQFSLEIRHINVPWAEDVLRSQATEIFRIIKNDPTTDKKLNVVYVNEIFGALGIAVANGYKYQGVTIESPLFMDIAEQAGILAHEMGHFFGLLHTHQYFINNPDRAEYVDGRQCGVRGDGICDTPVDPTLTFSVSPNTCSYTPMVQFTDNAGVLITEPDTKNIMSYTDGNCRDHFTPQQKNRLYKNYLYRTKQSEPQRTVKLKVYPNPVKAGTSVSVILDLENIPGELMNEGQVDESYQKLFYPILMDSAGRKVEEDLSNYISNTGSLMQQDGIPFQITIRSPGTFFVHVINREYEMPFKVEAGKIVVIP